MELRGKRVLITGRRGESVSHSPAPLPAPTDLLANADGYEPAAKSFKRMYRLGFATDTPRERVAQAVVKAVLEDRRHVRFPTRSAPFTMLVEIPRRLTEILLTGVAHQPKS